MMGMLGLSVVYKAPAPQLEAVMPQPSFRHYLVS